MSAPIFSHFDVLPNSIGVAIKARCKHCSTTISGRVNTTSNFHTHLRVSSDLIILGDLLNTSLPLHVYSLE